MDNGVTLGQVSHNLRMYASTDCDAEGVSLLMAWADAIDAHLTQPAQAVDVGAVLKVIEEMRAFDYPIPPCRDFMHNFAERITRALAGEQAGWRPIATAPQDGTRVLLWVDQTCRAGSWKYFPADAQNPCAPTHWMPLPASPAPDKETQR